MKINNVNSHACVHFLYTYNAFIHIYTQKYNEYSIIYRYYNYHYYSYIYTHIHIYILFFNRFEYIKKEETRTLTDMTIPHTLHLTPHTAHRTRKPLTQLPSGNHTYKQTYKTYKTYINTHENTNTHKQNIHTHTYTHRYTHKKTSHIFIHKWHWHVNEKS